MNSIENKKQSEEYIKNVRKYVNAIGKRCGISINYRWINSGSRSNWGVGEKNALSRIKIEMLNYVIRKVRFRDNH